MPKIDMPIADRRVLAAFLGLPLRKVDAIVWLTERREKELRG